MSVQSFTRNDECCQHIINKEVWIQDEKGVLTVEYSAERAYEEYILMPGEALRSLRTELCNLLEEKLSVGVLFRFGYRCGEALVERMQTTGEGTTDLEDNLKKYWERTGLGIIVSIEKITTEEVIVEQEMSTEALALEKGVTPSCDYTRGCMAGIANALTGRKYYCIESECISVGKDRCLFHLIEFPHRVYLPMKSKQK
jgi:predicted hydrocarbon binding protein